MIYDFQVFFNVYHIPLYFFDFSREIGGIFLLLKAVLNEFIYECKIRNLSPRTIKSYHNGNNLMIQWLIDNQSITEKV